MVMSNYQMFCLFPTMVLKPFLVLVLFSIFFYIWKHLNVTQLQTGLANEKLCHGYSNFTNYGEKTKNMFLRMVGDYRDCILPTAQGCLINLVESLTKIKKKALSHAL